MAKIVLIHNVPNLGEVGDVVTVKDGYARNYLFPRNLATKWTAGAQKQIDLMQAARRKREIASVEDARAIRDAIQSSHGVRVFKKATATGRLFAAVSSADVTDAVQSQLGQKLDRRTVVWQTPVKTTGDFKVKLHLHPEVEATLNMTVVRER
ncbi:MAG: 50S ribosomal protein L9 [Actinomycetaceae bacterium]|nr:50S ribosomal protein L9 [Actinomycetaceae bacterium]